METSIDELQGKTEEAKRKLTEDVQAKIDDLESLRPLQLLTEARHRELRDQFSDAFKAGMGAEAILEILRRLDLDTVSEDLGQELRTTSGQRRKKAIKRIRVVESFRRSSNKPEWMVLTALPVLPPVVRGKPNCARYRSGPAESPGPKPALSRSVRWIPRTGPSS